MDSSILAFLTFFQALSPVPFIYLNVLSLFSFASTPFLVDFIADNGFTDSQFNCWYYKFALPTKAIRVRKCFQHQHTTATDRYFQSSQLKPFHVISVVAAAATNLLLAFCLTSGKVSENHEIIAKWIALQAKSCHPFSRWLKAPVKRCTNRQTTT